MENKEDPAPQSLEELTISMGLQPRFVNATRSRHGKNLWGGRRWAPPLLPSLESLAAWLSQGKEVLPRLNRPHKSAVATWGH